jgi:hypothetical protein
MTMKIDGYTITNKKYYCLTNIIKISRQIVNLKSYILLAIFIISINSSTAQNQRHNNSSYKAWIKIKNIAFLYKGLLYNVNDSTIVLSNVVKKNTAENIILKRADFENIYIERIDNIKLRKKGNIFKGFLIGAVSGFAFGSLIGYLAGNDPPKQWFRMTAKEKALLYGSLSAEWGSIIGLFVGSIKISIPIDGDMENYNKNKKRLKEYSIKD